MNPKTISGFLLLVSLLHRAEEFEDCIEGSNWSYECSWCSCSGGAVLCSHGDTCRGGNECELPIEPGFCTTYQTRFGFNQTSGQCEPFIFGGCPINDNIFLTERMCEIACEEDPCEAPIDQGTCFYNFVRFGYNKTSGKCEVFIFKGCGGNGNKFFSLDDCANQCEDICNKEIDVGDCYTFTKYKRYAFNKTSGQCEEFVFFDCPGGNANKFRKEKDCEDKCEARCDKPLDLGTCNDYIPRYFYNQTSEQCENFIYGGCGGNGNNYLTEEKCETECEKNLFTEI